MTYLIFVFTNKDLELNIYSNDRPSRWKLEGRPNWDLIN